MKKFNLLLSILLLSSVWSYAQTISDEDQLILNKIKEGNTKHFSLASDFKQTKRESIFGEDSHSNGSLYYKKPELMAMQYTEPKGDLMLINENKFVMVSAGKRNETNSKSNARMRGIKNILTSCLEGNFTEMGADKIYCKENPKYYIVSAEINKRMNKSNVSKVTMIYDKQDYSLSILQMEEPDGSYTTYELINKKLNQPIQDEIFQVSK